MKEVQFRSSLYRCLFISVVVIVFGILTRHFLSQIPIEKKYLQKFLSEQSFKIENTKPEIRFSNGIKPILGLFVQRVSVHDPKCPARSALITDLLLTISPFELLKGNIILSEVIVGHLDVNEPKGCDFEISQSDPLNIDPVSTTEAQNLKALTDETTQSENEQPSLQKPKGLKVQSSPSSASIKKLLGSRKSLPAKKMTALFSRLSEGIKNNRLSRLKIKSLKASYWHSLQEQSSLKTPVEIYFKDYFILKMDIQEITYKGLIFPVDQSAMKILLKSDQIEMDWTNKVREGLLRVQLKQGSDNDLTSDITIEFDKVPLSPITQFLGKDHQLNFMWTNCKLALSSPLSRLYDTPLKVSECFIDGPYGKVVLTQLDSHLFKLNSAQVEIVKLDLDQVIKSKRDLYLSGVIANYGVLSGSLAFDKDVFESSGMIENTDFLFSNKSRRDLQKVKKIPWKIFGSFKDWKLQLQDLEIDNGEFDGLLELRYQAESRQTMTTQFTVNKLLLDDKIYQLMLGAQKTVLKIYGQFFLEGGKIENGYFMMASPELKTKDFFVSQLKLSGSYELEKGAEFKFSSQNGALQKDSDLYQWLHPTTLDKKTPLSNGSIEFEEVSLKATLKDILKWSRGYLRFSDGWQLSSEGVRDLDRELSGWIQWDQPRGAIMRWNYQGDYLKGLWTPDTQWVKEWLQDNPDFIKKSKSLVFVSEKKESLREKMNEVGKKAVNSVREVLKPKSHENDLIHKNKKESQPQ